MIVAEGPASLGLQECIVKIIRLPLFSLFGAARPSASVQSSREPARYGNWWTVYVSGSGGMCDIITMDYHPTGTGDTRRGITYAGFRLSVDR